MPETLDSFVSPRRMPASEKNVADIGKDDVRVRLLGTVIDKKDNVVVMDDGTGKINVVFEEPVKSESKSVRVFGRVMPAEKGFEIQGEILQEMDEIDLELYKKVKEIEKQ